MSLHTLKIGFCVNNIYSKFIVFVCFHQQQRYFLQHRLYILKFHLHILFVYNLFFDFKDEQIPQNHEKSTKQQLTYKTPDYPCTT